jgi:NAD(P)H-quinone oxidoreductase subunit 5
MSLSPVGLYLLIWVGAFTALFGGLVMMCQTSIKRNLAYSTIAQMGFMILQCGLGAFSAALLHIVAHSLFKAYSFLSSGMLTSNRSAAPAALASQVSAARSATSAWGLQALSLLLGVGITVGMAYSFGFTEKLVTVQVVLTLVFALALAYYILASVRSGQSVLGSAARSAAVALFYGLGLLAFEAIYPAHAPAMQVPLTQAGSVAVLTLVLLCPAFVAAYAIQFTAFAEARRSSFYVHALNGFYIDVIAHRIVAAANFGRWQSRWQVPGVS